MTDTLVEGPLPPAWGSYGCIHGRVIKAVGDDADPDALPGAKPITGTGLVTLTCLDGTRVVTDVDSGQTAVVPQAITCDLDSEGYIALNGQRDPWLWAGNWKISFGSSVGLPSWSFTVAGTETSDSPLQVMSKLGITPPSGAVITTVRIDASVQPGQYLGLDSTGTRVIGLDVSTGGGGGDVAPATPSSQGIVQLAGDLGGTAAAPTVTGGGHHSHTLDQVADSASRVAMTPAERAKLGAQSGTNTGDQVLPTWDSLEGRPAVVAAGVDQSAARAAIGAGTSSLAIGTTGSTAAAGNDARLSNSRTPTAHAASHASGGSDPITPASIGAGTSNLAIGTTAGTAAAGNDARLSDSRTPTAHAATHKSGGSDPVAPSDIGAATAAQGAKADSASQPGHTHAATDLVSGTVPAARLGSGSASASTYLRGDGTWATPSTGTGGISAVSHDGTLSGDGNATPLGVVLGTTAASAAAGNDARLSDARTPTAHAASHKTGGSDPLAAADVGAVPTSRKVAGHVLTGDVTVSASDVGLGNVNNTSDANKPVSSATSTALAAKAPLASPALTGTPTAPTATAGTSTTQVATTAFAMTALKTYELRGAGSPYGSVTPPSAGCYYTDTSGTCGAYRWVSTGTTNTSWIVEYGDTGPRNLIASILNGWNVNGIDFQRVGSSVSLRVDWLDGTSATDQIAFPIPAGFRPVGNLRFVGCLNGVAGGDTGIFGVEANNFVAADPSDKSQISGHMSLTKWDTTDAWPTTLPGTA